MNKLLLGHKLKFCFILYSFLLIVTENCPHGISQITKLKLSNISVFKLLSYFRVRFSFDSSFQPTSVRNSFECVETGILGESLFVTVWKCLLISRLRIVYFRTFAFPPFLTSVQFIKVLYMTWIIWVLQSNHC